MIITIACLAFQFLVISASNIIQQEIYDNILHMKINSKQPFIIQFRNDEMEKEGSIGCHYCKCISKNEQFEFISCADNQYILQWKTDDQFLQAYIAEKSNTRGKQLIHHSHHLNSSQQIVDITDMQSSTTGEHIQLYWKFNDNSTFDMVVIWNQLTWLGLAFDPGMDGTDFIGFEIVDNKLQVSDWYASCYCVPEPDKQQDVKLISYLLTDNGYAARIQRKLNTNDSFDKVLKQGEQYQFGYVFSEGYRVTYHYYSNSLNINFTQGVVNVNSQLGYLIYLMFLSIFL
ncbi:hypothetical protein pb186bvf_016906 [Paramecium bursaria]